MNQETRVDYTLTRTLTTMMDFCGTDILSVDQFHREDIAKIFALAKQMEPFAQRQALTRVLEGALLGNLFFEPSTRSRVSFGAAFNRLGGAVCDTTGSTVSSLTKGESLADTSRVMGHYVDCLVVRHPEIGAVQQFAKATSIPVINGGDGSGEHPTQALLDLYTLLKEQGKTLDQIDGLSITMIGDLKHGRTVHSLTKLLSLFQNIAFTFVSPKALQMPQDIVQQIQERGHQVQETEHFIEGLTQSQVLYMTRLQEERFPSPADFQHYRGQYSLNRTLYSRYCQPGTSILHPLPRDSRAEANELDNDLNDHPQLAIFRQAENGIPIRMALFALLLNVQDQVWTTTKKCTWYTQKS